MDNKRQPKKQTLPEFHIQDKIIRFTDNVVRVCTVFHPSYFVPTLM